jgi:aminopeptidase N
MRLLLIFILFISCTDSYSQNLRSGGKLKPEQAIMDIRHYTIALDVDPQQKTIDGYTEIDLVLSQSSPVILLDLWNGLRVKQTLINGKAAPFKHESDLITITPAKQLAAGKQKIKVVYGGTPAVAVRPPWTGGFQWEKDSLGNPWIAISCQGEGAKIYFPCKDHPSDEPNEGADMMITVPRGLMVTGPGLLQKSTTKKDKTTWHWKTNYTISNYCILFNVGKFKTVSREYTTIDGNKVPMMFYVLEENAAKAPHQLEMLERTTRILEKYFGEYPWAKEKIALCETPHLGMEHQTNIAYGNKFRYTKVGGEDFDWLMNHEFGHEWWANKVSNIDWAHMWIQEGICSYGDALYIRDMAGEEAYLKRMRETGRQQTSLIPVVRGEEVDTDSAYQGPIYGKGAFFMHTLRYVIGDDIFFPALKKLATDKRYTYDNFVHTKDVEQLFSSASGKDLKPLFDFYLYTNKKLEIRIRQTQDDQYLVQLLNFDGALPVDIATDAGVQRTTIDKKGVTVTSKTMPQADPGFYYLKKVTIE